MAPTNGSVICHIPTIHSTSPAKRRGQDVHARSKLVVEEQNEK